MKAQPGSSLLLLAVLAIGAVLWHRASRPVAVEEPRVSPPSSPGRVERLEDARVPVPAEREPATDVAATAERTTPPETAHLGALRGRVVDASGLPLDGLELQVALEGLLEEGWNRPLERGRRYRAAREQGDGSPLVRVTTDATGGFRVPGLMDAPYDVWATPESRMDRLTAVPVLADGLADGPADGRELVLVYERPHLVVRVLGEDGTPWSHIETLAEIYGGVRELHTPPLTVVDRWPDRPAVRVDALDQPVGLLLETAPPPGTRVGNTLVFEVRAGVRYRVGLFGGDQPWRPVTVEAGTGRTDVDLQVAPPLRPGTLALSARDAAGPVDRGVELRVEDPGDGFVLLRCKLHRGTWPLHLAVPEGTWRVVVDGRPEFAYGEWTLMEPGVHGRFETTVAVRSAEVTFVDADLPAGAVLELTVDGPPPAGEAAWREGRLRRSVIVRLCQPGRWPQQVAFVGPERLRRKELQDRIALGTTLPSERLPAGRWTLVGELPDGRVRRTEVVLVDGETTTARLEFGTAPPAASAAPVR